MPTDCNGRAIHFTPLGRRQVRADFDGGLITSDAGALLLREAAGRLNLFDRMAQAIPDPREPSMIEHEQRTMLAQRVLGIACGWEDLNDNQSLRNDPLFQVASGRGIDPAALARGGLNAIWIRNAAATTHGVETPCEFLSAREGKHCVNSIGCEIPRRIQHPVAPSVDCPISAEAAYEGDAVFT